MSERIQKRLADAGLGSRRQIEAWITEGRIRVNGEVATLGQKIDAQDQVKLDGRRVMLAGAAAPARVLLYRKRVGEVVTRDDPEGRQTVFRKLPPLEQGRWIAVGRLDINTAGLLLFTTDGELARRLMHPSFEINREYAVRVLGTLSAEMQDVLTRVGVELDGHTARFDSLRPGSSEADAGSANQWWTVTLHEGRHREVRRLFESQGLQVSRLIRLAYGPLILGRGIRSGGFRDATPAERNALFQAVSLPVPAQPSAKRTARAGQSEDAPARSRHVDPKPKRSRSAAVPAGKSGKTVKPKGDQSAPWVSRSRKRRAPQH